MCPEYDDDVKRALRFCADAREEWPLLDELRRSLPGSFHLAVIALFSPPSPDGWTNSGFRCPEGVDPKAVFYSAIALLGEVDVLRAAQQGRLAVAREYDCVFEVVATQEPGADMVQRFRRLTGRQQATRRRHQQGLFQTRHH